MLRHRLSAGELDDWLFRFDTVYPVHVINVHGLSQKDAENVVAYFVREVTVAIAKKTSFGDALLLREAENYNAEAIVTWNTKDFSRRTRLSVLTPAGLLAISLTVNCVRVIPQAAENSAQTSKQITAAQTIDKLVGGQDPYSIIGTATRVF